MILKNYSKFSKLQNIPPKRSVKLTNLKDQELRVLFRISNFSAIIEFYLVFAPFFNASPKNATSPGTMNIATKTYSIYIYINIPPISGRTTITSTLSSMLSHFILERFISIPPPHTSILSFWIFFINHS